MNRPENSDNPLLSHRYIDLLDQRLGGRALSCSDEWFAPCTNLVKPGRGVFKEGHFVDTGQWMDGWESRRSFGRQRPLDYDWCTLRLGAPGRVRGFDIDTNHFRGNAPEYAAVEAARVEGELNDRADWFEILPKSPLQAHSRNLFNSADDHSCSASYNGAWTHLRLKIYPDGGVARFRAYGEPQVDKNRFVEGELIDLASARNGGCGLLCSDMFYSSASNLLMPGPGIDMGDGWETRRRRDLANDWAIIRLGLEGSIRKVILDTAHFKGNFPDRFMLEAVNTRCEDLDAADIPWQTLIAETSLCADQEQLFIEQILVPQDAEFTHVRLNIYPDGGVSRLRIFGFPNWDKARPACG